VLAAGALLLRLLILLQPLQLLLRVVWQVGAHLPLQLGRAGRLSCCISCTLALLLLVVLLLLVLWPLLLLALLPYCSWLGLLDRPQCLSLLRLRTVAP
jgi:hypothetical protein